MSSGTDAEGEILNQVWKVAMRVNTSKRIAPSGVDPGTGVSGHQTSLVVVYVQGPDLQLRCREIERTEEKHFQRPVGFRE